MSGRRARDLHPSSSSSPLRVVGAKADWLRPLRDSAAVSCHDETDFIAQWQMHIDTQVVRM